MSVKKLAIDLGKQFHICDESINHFQGQSHVASQKRVKAQFSSGFFSARVVKPSECQFNGVLGRSLLRTALVSYTESTR